MQQLRLFIQTLRAKLGVPYPLAQGTPLDFPAGSCCGTRGAAPGAGLDTGYWLVPTIRACCPSPGTRSSVVSLGRSGLVGRTSDGHGCPHGSARPSQ